MAKIEVDLRKVETKLSWKAHRLFTRALRPEIPLGAKMPLDPETLDMLRKTMEAEAKRKSTVKPPPDPSWRSGSDPFSSKKWPPPPPPPRPPFGFGDDLGSSVEDDLGKRAEPTRPDPPRKEEPEYILSSPSSIRLEVATISVDTAKACVCLRAKVSLLVVNDLNRLLGSKWSYNKRDKVFDIDADAVGQLKLILKTHYKDVLVLGVAKGPPVTKFDKLMSKLDKDDKSKIYRILAAKYHPDRGGNHETMSLINQVFKEV